MRHALGALRCILNWRGERNKPTQTKLNYHPNIQCDTNQSTKLVPPLEHEIRGERNKPTHLVRPLGALRCVLSFWAWVAPHNPFVVTAYNGYFRQISYLITYVILYFKLYSINSVIYSFVSAILWYSLETVLGEKWMRGIDSRASHVTYVVHETYKGDGPYVTHETSALKK